MDLFRRHRKIWTVIVAIASLALIGMSFLPYLALLK